MGGISGGNVSIWDLYSHCKQPLRVGGKPTPLIEQQRVLIVCTTAREPILSIAVCSQL